MIIERMLVSPQLPPGARSIIVEYVEEKSFGLYGGSRRQQQRFAVRLNQRMREGGLQAVQADKDVVGTSRITELERRVRELERLLGRAVWQMQRLRPGRGVTLHQADSVVRFASAPSTESGLIAFGLFAAAMAGV